MVVFGKWVVDWLPGYHLRLAGSEITIRAVKTTFGLFQ
jgi:hypothetical protein